jgi:hypothetical protein
VLLVSSHEDYAIEGVHVYRGEELPQPGQVITVEVAQSPVPGPAKSDRARVTRVVPGDRFPVRATLLKR